jgi:nucleoid-associated protein YgaU
MRMRNSFLSIIVAGVVAATALPLAMAQTDTPMAPTYTPMAPADTPMAPADTPMAQPNSAMVQQVDPPRLAENAPDRYVVVQGDTLWGIAARFLRDPYRWPDVWEPNKDRVKNPHWIYPGDVLVLDRSGRRLRIRLATIKVEPRTRIDELSTAIASIPAGVIEPFLSLPLVVEEGGLANAPKIVATQEGRVYLGRGDLAYVTGDVDDKVRAWQIYRPGQALIDPDTKEKLGYEAVYLGVANVERRTNPITMRVTESKLEIGAGDRLVAAGRPELVDYIPRSPTTDIRGKVMSVYNATQVSEAGSQQIITISRGARDGVERGHVLALYSYGPLVADRTNILDRTRRDLVKLPDERNGLVFIFRVFDRVSYGLVMSAVQPVKLGDIAQKP